MEFNYTQLKQKDVISVSDGKNLGKAADITVSFPACDWLGITVPGCKGFKLTNKGEAFIPVKNIVKIGKDAILVKTDEPLNTNEKPAKPALAPVPDRRSYDEYE